MFDLHVHTKFSDGNLSPKELVALAKKRGLKGVGITDHDTVGGIEEGIEAGKIEKIKVIAGVELSCHWHYGEMHILGYFIDYTSTLLREKLKILQEKRQERINKMIKKAKVLGYQINIDEVLELAQGEAMGRPHLAQVLLKKGYISSVAEGFDRYLAAGKPFYVPRYKLSPQEAIEIVIQANGVPVIAHPGLYSAEWQMLLPELIDVGLRGLEVFYPEHSAKLLEELIALTKKYSLIMTGGSDFHGGQVKENILGSFGVNEQMVQLLEERKIE